MMRRIERGGSVTYVERHRVFSILLLGWATAVGLLPAFSPPRDPADRMVVLGWSLGLGVGALALLFRGRALHIDAAAGLLRVVDRGLFHRSRREEYPLRGLRVRSTMAEDNLRSRRWYIWIDVPGRPSLRFAGNIRNQERLHDLIVQLREDLGR